jgi:hypothetical protein
MTRVGGREKPREYERTAMLSRRVSFSDWALWSRFGVTTALPVAEAIRRGSVEAAVPTETVGARYVHATLQRCYLCASASICGEFSDNALRCYRDACQANGAGTQLKSTSNRSL